MAQYDPRGPCTTNLDQSANQPMQQQMQQQQQQQLQQQQLQQQLSQQQLQQQQIQQQMQQQQMPQQQIQQSQLPQSQIQQQIQQPQISQQQQISQQVQQQQIPQQVQQQQMQQQLPQQQIQQQQLPQVQQQLQQQQMQQQQLPQQQVSQQQIPQQQIQQIQQQHQSVPQQQQAVAVTMNMDQSNHVNMSSQSPLQQVQVLQQPLSASYYHYPQQQIMFPAGNLPLQHPTLQSITPQSISLQLQAKTNMDPKTSVAGQTLQAVNTANKGISLSAMAAGQVIGAGAKNFQQQIMTAAGKSAVIHSQSQFAPNNANQTVVIAPVNVLNNQQAAVYNQKALTDSSKGKTYMVNQPTTLQPKSPILYSSLPAHSSAQVFNGNQIKHLTSSPQLITSQAAGNVWGPIQGLGASLPQGISWATSGLQSQAFLAQNPIFIRSQQSDMYIQSPTQVLPVAAATAQVPATTYASATIAPPKPKQAKRITSSASVATQTGVSSSATLNSNTSPFRTQIKTKSKTISSHLTTPPVPGTAVTPQMSTTQTQTQVNQQQQQAQQSPQQPSQEQAPPPPPQPPLQQQLQQPQPPPQQLRTQQHNVPEHIQQQPPSQHLLQQQEPPVSVSSVPTVSVVSCKSTSPLPVCQSVSAAVDSSAVPSVSTGIQSSPVTVEKEPPAIELNNSTIPLVPDTNKTKILEPHSIEIRSLSHNKDKQPQKAIVKPQKPQISPVLTHVIDGHIIQEASEPFPVGRSSLLTEAVIPKPTTRREMANGSSDTSKVVAAEKKKKIHRVRGPVELAKCEFCGKMGAKSKFKRSKRFCSTSCAKRYNVCCSKRLGLLSQEKIEAGKTSKKKKVGRKPWKKLGEEKPLLENREIPMDVETVESTENPPDEKLIDTTKSEISPEVEVIMPSSPLSKSILNIDPSDYTHPSSHLSKWSVQEVFEYIRKIVGADYAEEFRSQEIDGQALMLLKEDHLMTAMKMKLGPALKLISNINSIKDEATSPQY